MRLKHYSLRTERCYCDWVERFIHFHRTRDARAGGALVSQYDFRTRLAAP
jgi:Phage integrase, N-terminal SAM-like domain